MSRTCLIILCERSFPVEHEMLEYEKYGYVKNKDVRGCGRNGVSAGVVC